MSVVKQHLNYGQGIDLSPAAANHILSYLRKDPQNKGVRFSAKKSGCSGWSYEINYVTAEKPEDLAFPFTGNEESCYQIYIDKASYPLIKGIQVDYVKQGLNYKFIFTNPNQTGQCGCGESFTIT